MSSWVSLPFKICSQSLSCITLETIRNIWKKQTDPDVLGYIINNYDYILYYVCNNNNKGLEYVFVTLVITTWLMIFFSNRSHFCSWGQFVHMPTGLSSILKQVPDTEANNWSYYTHACNPCRDQEYEKIWKYKDIQLSHWYSREGLYSPICRVSLCLISLKTRYGLMWPIRSIFSISLVCELLWSLIGVSNCFLTFLDNDLFCFTRESMLICLLSYHYR